MNYKISSLLIFLFSLIFALSTCAEENNDKSLKIKLGMLLTLSGSFASVGEDQRKGIEAALAASPISELVIIIYSDSKNDPVTGISEFQNMNSVEKVSAVFLNRATIGIPINPISKLKKIPILGSVGHDNFLPANEYAFQLWPSAKEEGGFLANKSLSQGSKKIAIIHTEDEYMTSVVKNFKEGYLSQGGQIILDESVRPEEHDFRSLLIRLKQKSPDTIYFNLSIPQIISVMRQLKELNIKTKLLSNFYISKKEVLDAVDCSFLDGIQFAEIMTDLPNLKTKLNISKDEKIPALGVSAYVATTFLLQAVKRLKEDSNISFYQALLLQKEIKTPDYNYKVVDRHVKFPLILKELRSGKIVEVSN